MGELFAGFQLAYSQLFLGALVITGVVNACLLPFQYVWQSKWGPLQDMLQSMQNDPTVAQHFLSEFMAALTSCMPALFICLVPAAFFSVSWAFAVPLIIDKQMHFVAALKTSWRMVMKHWWQVLGLVLVAGLLSGLGALACCIGVVFTLPISFAAMMFAYETIFGVQRN